MEQKIEPSRVSLKTWVYAIFVVAFVTLWLSGMTAGLIANMCRGDRYEGSKKLQFCNISLTAGAWTRVSTVDRAKGSIIQLERGIALTQLGQENEAIKAFEKALLDARTKTGSWEERLHQRMALVENNRTRDLWTTVVASRD